MITHGSYAGIFWNHLVGTEGRRGCVIIPIKNNTVAQVNNDGEGLSNYPSPLYDSILEHFCWDIKMEWSNNYSNR